MADAISDSPEPTKSPSAEPENVQTKFYRHFLPKSALATTFLVLLPLFPSIAPEFINRTLHARTWELLQLILVGIAVSYGLFGQRNSHAEKDQGGGGDLKYDSSHSYLSSVFDDDDSESTHMAVHEECKLETSKSQYFRGASTVMVAEQMPTSVVKKENSVVSDITHNKPLLLPVRSLKQRLLESDHVDSAKNVTENTVEKPIRSLKQRLPEFGHVYSVKNHNENNVEKPARSLKHRLPETGLVHSAKNLTANTIQKPARSLKERLPMSGDVDSSIKPNQNTIKNPNNSLKQQAPVSSHVDSCNKPNSRINENSKIPRDVDVNGLSFDMVQNISVDEMTDEMAVLRSPIPWRSRSGSIKMDMNGDVIDGSRLLTSLSDANELTRLNLTRATDSPSKSCPVLPEADYMARKKNPSSSSSFSSSPQSFQKPILLQSSSVFAKNEVPLKKKLVEKDVMVMESSDDDSEDGGDDSFEGGGEGLTDKIGVINGDDGSDEEDAGFGPDVDKKADEFIARFREQIRLQRIDSFKKSSARPAVR